MKIQKINNFSFKADIIDSHVHRGSINTPWKRGIFPTEKLDEFIKQPLDVNIAGTVQTDNIKKVLVSNIDAITHYNKDEIGIPAEDIEFIKDETSANKETINFFKENNTYEVMLVCQPAKTNGSADKIRNLIEHNQGKIAGMKFHPVENHLRADSELYDDYLKLAEEYKLPCLFHSEVAIDYILNCEKEELSPADPEYIYTLAKRHPNTPIILGHTGLGGEIAHQKAIGIIEQSLKNKDAKLYAEISWMDYSKGKLKEKPENILALIRMLKSHNALDRILFGTDAPLGIYGELQITEKSPKESYADTVGTLKTAIKKEFPEDADIIIERLFYNNADDLFFKNREPAPKKDLKKEVLTVAGSLVGICLGILALSKIIKRINK